MREAVIEAYLARRVKRMGGEVRKAQWVGRRACPDRYVMLPDRAPFWVECKSPSTIKTFPAGPGEHLQELEHQIMRSYGVEVYVVGTKEQVDAILHPHLGGE